jgi:hypothetical protein
MQRKLLISLVTIAALSLGAPIKFAHARGMFDWMSPNKWFNGRDNDRGYYRDYGYPGYAYPGYVQPGWGGYGYPGYTPGYVYPGYAYPIQPQQNTTKSTPPLPPTPQ